MKILLISDIHANVDGLEIVLQKHADADRILYFSPSVRRRITFNRMSRMFRL